MLWAVTMARECCGSSPGAEMPAWQTQARQAGRWAVSSLDCPRGSPSHPSAGGRAFPHEECRRSSPDWLALVGAGGRQFSAGGVAIRAAQRLGWPRGSPASPWRSLAAATEQSTSVWVAAGFKQVKRSERVAGTTACTRPWPTRVRRVCRLRGRTCHYATFPARVGLCESR